MMLIYVFVTGKHREDLWQRFGFYRYSKQLKREKSTSYWLHASSVGEVKAARAVIAEIKRRDPDSSIVVTTMTLHGRKVAEKQLAGLASCFLAPLDIPGIVEHTLSHFCPSHYICIETELWPVLFHALAKRDVRLSMVNGRISDRSFSSYMKIRWLIKNTVGSFSKMAVISELDRNRYISLGGDPRAISSFGNVKYDMPLPSNRQSVMRKYKEILNITQQLVFVAGSTHSGEEDQMLKLYESYLRKRSGLLILAPRHVERIGEIEKLLKERSVGYQRLSRVLQNEQERREQVLIVDTMGELAQLYSVADYVFCGGSLVQKGGHNLMEPALWQKVVFHGPNIEDFKDAAEMLESAKCGICVASIGEIVRHLSYFANNPEEYSIACQGAATLVNSLQGCAARQVDFIIGNDQS